MNLSSMVMYGMLGHWLRRKGHFMRRISSISLLALAADPTMEWTRRWNLFRERVLRLPVQPWYLRSRSRRSITRSLLWAWPFYHISFQWRPSEHLGPSFPSPPTILNLSLESIKIRRHIGGWTASQSLSFGERSWGSGWKPSPYLAHEKS